MGDTLQAAKDTVMNMFDLLVKTFDSQGLEEGCFEMMIGLYRNYSSREQVFVNSPFSSKPDTLRQWLQVNGIDGGQGMFDKHDAFIECYNIYIYIYIYVCLYMVILRLNICILQPS